MLTPTHLVTAQVAYFGACLAAAHPPAAAEAAVALGAALLPDLDAPRSYIGRVLWPLAAAIERRFGHRTLTHSLLAQVAAGLAAWWLLAPGFALALLAGWVSHSFADMMTPSGVCWFWPSRVRCVLPGNPRYRMETGGAGELGFVLVMALAGLALLPLAQTGKGTAGLIRGALGHLDAARAEYDRDKGAFAFSVTLRGRDNRSHADVSGTYGVLGPWGEAGLILASPHGARSLCAGSACDWYADHVELARGAALATTSFELSAPVLPVAALERALAPLTHAAADPAAHTSVLLLGAALAEGVKPTPPTLEVNGAVLTFVYADPGALAPLSGRTLREVALTVQVRHPPGVAVPAPAALPQAAPALPAGLQRWLR